MDREQIDARWALGKIKQVFADTDRPIDHGVTGGIVDDSRH